MDRNGIIQSLQAEATRRFSGQPASNVGMQQNPSASQPATPQAPNMMQTQSPVTPSAGNPFGGASQAMNGSMPLKGGTHLERSLVKRMMMYPPV